MGFRSVTIYVEGMTCPACEARIAQSLLASPGVLRAEARLRGGRVLVDYEEGLTGLAALEAIIEKAGYGLRGKGGAGGSLALGIGILLGAAYLLASASGLFNAFPKVDASLGYAMLLVAGLLTSIHCVAMCGGIALSQSLAPSASGAAPASAASGSGEGRLGRLRPGLLYNGGRVLSYTLIGGIVGALGSAFSFSPAAKGLIAGLAGLFMVLLGLRMLGILGGQPWLDRLLPARLRGLVGGLAAGLRKRGPLALGLLNGLMPCGPLQTMQLYALGTGSAVGGALSMLLFSLGTLPLMLIFGLGAALLPRRFLPRMIRASAVLVLVLGLVTFGRAASLAGLALPVLPALSLGRAKPPSAAPGLGVLARDSGAASLLSARVEGEVQTVLTEFKDGYYVPFAVQAGVPLKWTIRIRAEDLNGCNNPIVIPAYNIQKELVAGDNLVEFTPARAGTISYSCWMGMIRSKITVVSDLGSVDSLGPDDLGLSEIPDQGSRSCCSGSTDPAFVGGRIPADTIGMPVIEGDVQRITIVVKPQGYSPAAILLQKGMKAIISFRPEGLNSCNNPVVFPEFNGVLDLAQGQLETPLIPVESDFSFRCWMGMINGYVKVVDDLGKVDIEKVRAELSAIRGAGGASAKAGGCCGSAASPPGN